MKTKKRRIEPNLLGNIVALYCISLLPLIGGIWLLGKPILFDKFGITTVADVIEERIIRGDKGGWSQHLYCEFTDKQGNTHNETIIFQTKKVLDGSGRIQIKYLSFNPSMISIGADHNQALGYLCVVATFCAIFVLWKYKEEL